MCCPAGFSSMLVQVYHLGSVHPEKLRVMLDPTEVFLLLAVGTSRPLADRYMLPPDFYQLDKSDFICAAHW